MRSLKREALTHSKSSPTLHKQASCERETEDFREVRSRLRKTSSRSPSKPPVKFKPDPPPTHYSPPARIETVLPKEEPKPAPKEQPRLKESKGKEREAPRLVRTVTDHNDCIKDNGWRPPPPVVTDHNDCIKDNGWRPPPPVVRDHDKCLDDTRPTKPPPEPKVQNKSPDRPRGRAREQPSRPARETPRDHAPRQPRDDPVKAADVDHKCEWKDKYITLQADVDSQGRTDDIGLEGLTIVLHMQGRDDLVINTDLRNLE